MAEAKELRAALERVTGILDIFGDLSDTKMDPEVWRSLKAEEAITQAKAALASQHSTAAEPACPRGHSWNDFGQLGGRNVSWCPRCDALAFTGQEPDSDVKASPSAVAGNPGVIATKGAEEAVAEVVMATKPPKASDAWLPFKTVYASLAWLDAQPVGTKLYAANQSRVALEVAAEIRTAAREANMASDYASQKTLDDWANRLTTPSQAAEKGEPTRLRAALEVVQQAFVEMYHARTNPNWFTHGKQAADSHFFEWHRKGVEALATAMAASNQSKSEVTLSRNR